MRAIRLRRVYKLGFYSHKLEKKYYYYYFHYYIYYVIFLLYKKNGECVGGAADKNGTLRVGDEIISVNNVDVTRMTRLEAWNYMKKLNDGQQTVVVRQKLINLPTVRTQLVGESAPMEKTH